MSSEDYLNRRTLVVFHDGLAWLMQVAMFLSMGLLVNPSRILSVLWPGLIFSLALIVLARPLSVGLCLFPFRYTCKEVWFLSWGGPRGAVPIILATYLLVEKIPHSETLFNLVFLIVITTTLIQGPSMGAMSRWMKVQEAIKVPKKLPFKSRHRQSEFIEFFIGPHSPVKGKSIFELHLPKDILVVLIHRHGKDFIPRERTKIEGQDRIVCLAAKSSIPKTEAIFGSEHFLERKIG